MKKDVPSSLKALGRENLPDTIDVRGACFKRERIFKNDFFAVTALYQRDSEKVLLKVQRQASFWGLPMRWLGRILARREWALLELASDIRGIPKLITRWGETGIIREFIDGKPLEKGRRVPDEFHGQLREIIDALHARNMAYVDLEKCENVLLGDDGRPYLFDFQIAWYLSKRFGGELWPMRKLRTWLQNGDRYHLVKLQRRTRPDQLTPLQLAASYKKPWYLHTHRLVTMPFTRLRRMILDRIDPRRGGSERGKVVEDIVTGDQSP